MKQLDYVEFIASKTWYGFTQGTRPENVAVDDTSAWVITPNVDRVDFYINFKERYKHGKVLSKLIIHWKFEPKEFLIKCHVPEHNLWW